ncbi:sensor histidine kinase [Anaerocolumna sp. MB42-C2]|uniref:sensor histidine kinase n=1 Tax=Anaerocolumna sp. MB42-C2 TaxID=3070997 RepID=UPI0027DF6FF0|nr:histidine kinase [Anaerocolumna sp. MB42-C2]WMJ89187.1 histidine kinase [Anaerocolumna sp. MB42-C2]
MILTKKTHTVIRIKVKKQMYFILIPLIIIPVLFIGIALTSYFVKALYQQTSSQLESDNIRVKSIVVDCVINLFNVSSDLLDDKSLHKLLTTNYTNSEDALAAVADYDRFQDYMDTTTSMTSVTVYTTNPTLPDGKYIKTATPEIIDKLFSKVSVPSGSSWGYNFFDRNIGNTSSELLLVRSIPLVKTHYSAILVITVSNNFLKNKIQNNSLYTAISLNKEPVFFSTTRSMQGKDQSVPIDYNSRYFLYNGLIQYKNKTVFGYISSLPVYQSKDILYVTTIDFAAIDKFIKIVIMCAAITLLSILIPLLGIVFYTNFFSSRILALRLAMKNASKGDFNMIDSLRGDDELSETFTDLQYMVLDLKDKEAKMYEAQLLEKEILNQQQQMEFKILASQINPHFIYNTLETIRMLAIEENNQNVSSAIWLLGKSLRYVLENTETFSTTLDKELDYINVYLQIQKLRFEDRIDYTIEIPEHFAPNEYQILPLLLQPIVENAVLHGLDDISKNGDVIVRLSTDNSTQLIIDIMDNGKGMPEEVIKTFNSDITLDKSASDRTSIGLNNIKRRIRLFYGDNYSINIKSSTENGTHIQLILPLIPI